MLKKINIKWIAVILFVIAVYRGPIIIQRIKERTFETEAGNYLRKKYPGIKFWVNGTKVYTKTPFKIQFKVRKVFEGYFFDDYKEQLVKHIAEQNGIQCEASMYGVLQYDSGTNLIVYYPNYESIDSMAAQFVNLVKECREYDVLRNGTTRLTISPGDSGEVYFPGYILALSESSLMAEDDPLTDLASHLKDNYIYVTYNYSIPDVKVVPESDIKRYQESVPGIVVVSANGEEEVFPLVAMRELRAFGIETFCLDFGGAYQILKSQGAEIEINKNKFTAEINGRTVEILIEFEKNGPKHKWCFPKEDIYGDYDVISIEMMEQLIGKKIEEGAVR